MCVCDIGVSVQLVFSLCVILVSFCSGDFFCVCDIGIFQCRWFFCV